MSSSAIRQKAQEDRSEATTCWIRFSRSGSEGFGTVEGEAIAVHAGDMFAGAQPTGETVPLAEVTLLAPVAPSKIIALWNNFHALAGKLSMPVPPGAALPDEGAVQRGGAGRHDPAAAILCGEGGL